VTKWQLSRRQRQRQRKEQKAQRQNPFEVFYSKMRNNNNNKCNNNKKCNKHLSYELESAASVNGNVNLSNGEHRTSDFGHSVLSRRIHFNAWMRTGLKKEKL